MKREYLSISAQSSDDSLILGLYDLLPNPEDVDFNRFDGGQIVEIIIELTK